MSSPCVPDGETAESGETRPAERNCSAPGDAKATSIRGPALGTLADASMLGNRGAGVPVGESPNVLEESPGVDPRRASAGLTLGGKGAMFVPVLAIIPALGAATLCRAAMGLETVSWT